MAVRIRLRRIGKKKQPQYRLVAAEGSGPRDGRFLESIGHYNPRVDPPAVSVNEERALWWLKQGAQPTDTAKSMLVKTGVWEKFTGEPAPAAPRAAEEPETAEVVEPSEGEIATNFGGVPVSPGEDEEGQELESPPEEAGEEKEQASGEDSERGR